MQPTNGLPWDKIGSGGVSGLLRSGWSPPAEPKISYVGKTVVITGANTGIGFEAAIKFARLGASLVLGLRSAAKSYATQKKIAEASKISVEDIKFYEVDYTSFASVERFAQEIQSLDRVDVLVSNAGIASPSFQISQEGWENTIQVNALSTALLCILILPKLHMTAKATETETVLEITGSEAYLDVSQDWLGSREGNDSKESILHRFNKKENFRMDRQYHISKLFVMFLQEGIVKGLEEQNIQNVTVLVTSPGMCRTDLGRNFGTVMKVIMLVFQSIVARTAEQGGRALASGPGLSHETAHGAFWYNDKCNEQIPRIEPESWKQLQEKEFDVILSTLEEACPGTRQCLNL